MSILAVGSIAYDSIKTPHGKVDKIMGGSLTHFCASATHFSSVKMVGIVGGDFDFKQYDFLAKRGVDFTGIDVIKGGKTFCWEGEYVDEMNEAKTLSTCINVFETFSPVIGEKLKKSKFVFLGNIDPELQLKVLSQVEKPKLIVLDTMNLWIDTKREILQKAISRAHFLLINDREALSLTREDNIISAAKILSGMGPRCIVIKKGGNGAYLRFEGKFFVLPAYPLEKVVDPTGAGDSFAGGFLGYLSRCKTINFKSVKMALVYGTVVASFNVASFGAEGLKQIEKKDIDARLRKFLNIIRV